MIRKSLKIKFVTLLIGISAMTGLLANSGVSASESDSDNAPGMNLRITDDLSETVSGTVVTARSTIGGRMGSGSTSADYYDPYLTAYVSGTFEAINPITGYSYTNGGPNQGISSAVISYLAPEGYESNYMDCHHFAEKNGVTWDTYTYISA